MYCSDCNSGVHARCFGNGHMDNIDKIWRCNMCREKKLYYEWEKDKHKLQGVVKQTKSIRDELDKLEKKLL